MPEKNLPEIILKPGKERSLIRRHPWLFSGAIAHSPKAEPGSIVQVNDSQGKFLACGFFDPASQIRCRLFEFDPTQIVFDESYWFQKFHNASLLRKKLLDPKTTNGYRLIHAEGDYIPGIIADIYGDLASVQIRVKGAMRLKDSLVKFLKDELNIRHVFIGEGEKKEGDENRYWIEGKKESAEFLENGFSFSTIIEGGQKTGYFLDQRENRALVQHYAKGRKVVDLFSYAGGFSVHALGGGAESVVSVDSSAQANQLALSNLEKNFPGGKFEAVQADCFEFLKELEYDKFDMIVLDPPAFTKHISTVDKAARGYKEINLKALKKISPGGLLFTYSCSQHISSDLFRKIIFGAATDAGRKVRVLHQLTQAPDHPIDIFHPEGEYLKGLALYVE